MAVNNSNMVIVVPPWTIIDTPNLGVHLLQAIGKENGVKISVFYSDQTLGRTIGIKKYRYISEKLVSQYELIQERLFAKAAYPDCFKFLGNRIDENGPIYPTPRSDYDEPTDWDLLYKLEPQINKWIEDTVEYIVSLDVDIIGFSISHQQVNASIALINRIKKISPNKIIVVGGSNCDGCMAEGILTLSTKIDYVFSGKSEVTFKEFLRDYCNGILPKNKIIKGKVIKNLDDIPFPCYDDYFRQLKENKIKLLDIWFNVESSRGCWWGTKSNCKFCGVNGKNELFNCKSSKRIISEIKYLTQEYSISNIRMVDTLMPKHYLKSVIPQIKDLNINIFYEQRADLTFDQMNILKKSGINYIQIGIESLAQSHLDLIGKGVTVSQNINALRFSYINKIYNGWNLLYNIPQEDDKGWKETLKLLPFIIHLPSPTYFRPVELARFSPYYDSPAKYGIKNLRPFEVYYDVFPKDSDIFSLAWLFKGDYDTSKHRDPDLIELVNLFVIKWIDSWSDLKKRRFLHVIKHNHLYFLVDTREIKGTKRIRKVTEEETSVILLGEESRVFKNYKDWLLRIKCALIINGIITPLAVCDPDLYINIQCKYKKHEEDRHRS